MQDTRYIPYGENDLARLMDAMERLKDRNHQYVDEEVFDDKSVAVAFNHMLDGVMAHNNEYLMRINDAQKRIADNSTVRQLIDLVRLQEEPLRNMKEMSSYLRSSSLQNEEKQIEMLALTRQTNYAVKSLQKLLTAGEEEYSFLGEKFHRLVLRLEEMSERLQSMQETASALYNQDSIKSEMFTAFDEEIAMLAGNYEELVEGCFQNGSRLYRINRDIDNARNDMYRSNSNATLIDRTKIFAIDHLTLTWRLYYNAVEYEHLKITQLNNPDRCKFGLWCEGITHPLLKESKELKAAMAAHEELHRHAVACYVAKEASDIPESMKEFENALESWGVYADALERLADLMRQNGLSEETAVWVFKQ